MDRNCFPSRVILQYLKPFSPFLFFQKPTTKPPSIPHNLSPIYILRAMFLLLLFSFLSLGWVAYLHFFFFFFYILFYCIFYFPFYLSQFLYLFISKYNPKFYSTLPGRSLDFKNGCYRWVKAQKQLVLTTKSGGRVS